jgi:hypothetical protein
MSYDARRAAADKCGAGGKPGAQLPVRHEIEAAGFVLVREDEFLRTNYPIADRQRWLRWERGPRGLTALVARRRLIPSQTAG